MYRLALAVVLCGSCRGALALEDGLSMVQAASVKEASTKEASMKVDSVNWKESSMKGAGSKGVSTNKALAMAASAKEASAKEASAKESWPWSRKKRSHAISLAQKGDQRASQQQHWGWPWSRAPSAPPAEKASPAGSTLPPIATEEQKAEHVTSLAKMAAAASVEVAHRRAAEASADVAQRGAVEASVKVNDQLTRGAVEAAVGPRWAAVITEQESGETNVDAVAGVLQGAAKRLSDEEAKLVADNWATYSDADVTFSYATHCNAEHGCRGGERPVRGEPSAREMHKNMLNSLRALRFCFADVLVVLDTPHKGADIAGSANKQLSLEKNLSIANLEKFVGDQGAGHHWVSLADGELMKRSEQALHWKSAILQYEESVLSKVDHELLEMAVETAKAAAELLRDHCAGYTPAWKVQLVNYASSGVQDLAKSHYRIPASAESDMFEKMYANTMVLDQNFQAKSRYVYHMDAQYRIYRNSWAKSAPNFVEKALSLMRSDARVYMASVVSTPNMEPERDRTKGVPGAVRGSAPHERMNGLMQGWKPVTGHWNERPVRAENFNANWNAHERQEARKMKLLRLTSKDGGSVVSTRQFLMDVDRFKGLFPLAHWDRPADNMWAINMDQQSEVLGQAYQVFFNETCGVFAGPSEPRLGPGIAG